ncbi:DUF1013 domain-containing protein [Agrobacterium tumefaciens]|nr:DUF1013 domain-containing protein [Agrobacterium tumefaciens]
MRTAIRQRSFVSQRIAIMMQSGYRAAISRKSVVDTTPATPARTDRRTVSMAQQLLMPKATAVWLVDNTALSFDQIATFCKLHPLEVKAIADGEAAQGIKGLDPIATGQLSRDEIARAEGNPNHKLKLSEPKVRVPESKRRGPRYTPVSKRQDRPNAILWLVRNHPELKDAQISRLVGTTKSTIEQIRDRTHWNSANLTPMDPVTLGLCSQIDLDLEVERASRGRPLPTAEELDNTLQPATATEGLDYNFQREEDDQIDADAVFKKLSSLKSTQKDEDEDDQY